MCPAKQKDAAVTIQTQMPRGRLQGLERGVGINTKMAWAEQMRGGRVVWQRDWERVEGLGGGGGWQGKNGLGEYCGPQWVV